MVPVFVPAAVLHSAVVGLVTLFAGCAVLAASTAYAEAARLTAGYVEASTWSTGYGGGYTVTNAGDAMAEGWTVEFDHPAEAWMHTRMTTHHSGAAHGLDRKTRTRYRVRLRLPDGTVTTDSSHPTYKAADTATGPADRPWEQVLDPRPGRHRQVQEAGTGRASRTSSALAT
ncbi:cellulose binding domain-containing protein [Plantactinospora mayteni]|uniref:cellulose binding domain-containing protein n=1 Tax=Plantactinospora mayteni TaxID=566021 RepID=UPI001944A3A7|nr:cellulose binding domain-containing protein [Plantactinospora mayteni]